MRPLEKIKRTLAGESISLTTDEESVVIMACHLESMAICDLASVNERRQAVADLPESIAERIKAEVVQEFNRRRSSPQQSDER